ncbi:serine/threonine protein kinase [Paenibacillus albicereus]|uniref:serine/threonine protein kinase n=1 Tax=Paenibacillus albicereus TaxID=2726185 RepID=UPI001F1DCDF8|nr:serine/threonine protein kinase [Paenibacillus albicereus]
MEEAMRERHAARIQGELLPGLDVVSVKSWEPVQVRRAPQGWKTLGCGNYAAVFAYPGDSRLAVKVYAPGRDGWEAERQVYRQLGEHPAYGRCYASGEHGGKRWLLLRRLHGKTLYDCLLQGVPIPEQAIRDVDAALDYAISRGLRPHDVHGKNVMVQDGRGIVIDVSDFLKQESCSMWGDLKRAYRYAYKPLLGRKPFPVPVWAMNRLRSAYRWVRRRSKEQPCRDVLDETKAPPDGGAVSKS